MSGVGGHCFVFVLVLVLFYGDIGTIRGVEAVV